MFASMVVKTSGTILHFHFIKTLCHVFLLMSILLLLLYYNKFFAFAADILSTFSLYLIFP